MFFIFGWGRGTATDLGPTLPLTCPNCRNDTVWHFHEHKKWFTLFFLPVFPYDTKHVLLCPICSHGIQLRGNQLDQARRLNSAAQSYFADTMSEDQFQAALGHGASALPLLATQSHPDSLQAMRDIHAAQSRSTPSVPDNDVPPQVEPRKPMSLFWKVTLTLFVLLLVLRIIWVLMKEGL